MGSMIPQMGFVDRGSPSLETEILRFVLCLRGDVVRRASEVEDHDVSVGRESLLYSVCRRIASRNYVSDALCGSSPT